LTRKSKFHTRKWQETFLFTIAPIPALEPRQSPIQTALVDASAGIKRQEREDGHKLPFKADVKNAGATPQLPHTHLHDVVDNLAVTKKKKAKPSL
jgi:hypothetical protein